MPSLTTRVFFIYYFTKGESVRHHCGIHCCMDPISGLCWAGMRHIILAFCISVREVILWFILHAHRRLGHGPYIIHRLSLFLKVTYNLQSTEHCYQKPTDKSIAIEFHPSYGFEWACSIPNYTMGSSSCFLFHKYAGYLWDGAGRKRYS